MTADADVWVYALCIVLIIVYAWGRFNTPASNRSSTRQALYWWSCLGYIATGLLLFLVLTVVLHSSPLRHLLLGAADDQALPAPLIATLVMTTLLPSVPALKRLDASLLATFLEWAAIPAEVTRRAAAMTHEEFTVSEADLDGLRAAFGDGSYGEALAGHLRADRAQGLAQSQYWLTCVAKLYDRVRRLAAEPRYARFFAENAEQDRDLEQRAVAFLRRSSGSLTVAARLRATETAAEYEELMAERRAVFAQACDEMFRELSRFLAHAVLRSESTERTIVARLRQVGFEEAEPINEPEFPIDSLTLLGCGIFVYLTAVGTAFRYLQLLPDAVTMGQPSTPALMALKIALARLGAIGAVLYVIQRYPFFRRPPGAPHRYFAYLACGVLGGVVASVLALAFGVAILSVDPVRFYLQLLWDLPTAVLSGMVCLVLAFCCNDWPEGEAEPAWLRRAEAGGCAAVVALGMGIMCSSGLLPIPSEYLTLRLVAIIVTLPSIMAAMIGAFVPHIYRRARQAAQARRDEAAGPARPVAFRAAPEPARMAPIPSQPDRDAA